MWQTCPHHINTGFINCWVISNVELYLMWNTYSSLDKGLAIKTTIGNLIDSLDPCDDREVFISDVNYIDYYHDYKSEYEKNVQNVKKMFEELPIDKDDQHCDKYFKYDYYNYLKSNKTK